MAQHVAGSLEGQFSDDALLGVEANVQRPLVERQRRPACASGINFLVRVGGPAGLPASYPVGHRKIGGMAGFLCLFERDAEKGFLWLTLAVSSGCPGR